MSTVWNGNGTLVSPTVSAGTRLAIVSSTNASPIVVTTGTHGYNTGDSVEIEGHATNTAANGQWQITVKSPTTFALNNSTGNGVGGATGYCIDYELQPALTMPANGVIADINDVIALGEGLSNPAPFLYRLAGKWRLYNEYNLLGAGTLTLPYYSSPWSVNNNFTSTTPAVLASTTLTFASASSTTSIPPVFNSGDLIVYNISTTAYITTHTGTQNALVDIGFGLVQSATLTPLLTAQTALASYVYGGISSTPINLSGARKLTTGGALSFPTNALSFCLWAAVDYISAANQIDVDLIGPWSGSILQYRPN